MFNVCSVSSIEVSVICEGVGDCDGEKIRSSPVLITDVSVVKVAFSVSVNLRVNARDDWSHGSGGW